MLVQVENYTSKMPLKRKSNLFFLSIYYLTSHRFFNYQYYYVLYLQFLGEVVSDNSSEGGEQGSQEDTDITDVYGDVEKM